MINRIVTWWDSLWGMDHYDRNRTPYNNSSLHTPINFPPAKKTPAKASSIHQNYIDNTRFNDARTPPKATFFSKTDGVEYISNGPPETQYLLYWEQKDWETKQLRLKLEALTKERNGITTPLDEDKEDKNKEIGFLGQK